MSRFRRPSLADFSGYVPGEQPADADGWIKLNTNEAPFPPSPRVAEALSAEAAAGLRRYPHPSGEPLRTAVARHHGLEPAQVLVGNGADQVLDACFRAFAEPGESVVLTEPTYSLLPVLARICGLPSTSIHLRPDGSLPGEFISAPGRVRFIVNPNSPTGTWMDPHTIEVSLAGASSVVVIDEAYGDFAPASCVPLLEGHDNWLVVRTFAKSYALAGLRVGYALGHPDLITDLAGVLESYPVDRLGLLAAEAALADAGHHRRIVEAVITERARLTHALLGAGWTVGESRANFVLAMPPREDAAAVAQELRRQRILVRHFPRGAFSDRLRITVGTVDENTRLLHALGVAG